MRCKNCGADNNDNRYICEVCGSPLYDETEIMPTNDNQKTQTFNAVSAQNKPAVYSESQKPDNNNNDNIDNGGDKKNVIIIAVLVVILIAVVASIVAIANNNKNQKEPETELTKYSSTTGEDKSTSEKTTEETTEETTKSTTTTEKQTTAAKWIINASSSGGGEVEGDGEYYNGDKVVLIARADDGFVFDGWYSNGIKVSSSTKYSFTANENASFSAVFNQVEYEPPTDNSNDTEVNFGE